jgi:ubiquitin-conjugating enzyme E2 O
VAILKYSNFLYRPGDYVLWKNEEERRVAIIQAVSASDRVATVLWVDTGVIEDVSVLELDQHGLSFGAGDGLDAFGLRRGENVLIHKIGSSNGLKEPLVPRIGELEAWVNDVPTRTPDGTVEGWRGELTNIAMKSLGYETSRREKPSTKHPSLPLNDSWMGQVVDVMSGGQPGKFDSPQIALPIGVSWFGQVIDVSALSVH